MSSSGTTSRIYPRFIKINADPCGSGSGTLVSISIFRIERFIVRSQLKVYIEN
jgi:hypothetical protein